MRSHSGQALVESLAALLVLVPLFASLWLVAGLHDLRITLDSAARYLAMHRVLSPGASPQLASQIVRRQILDRERDWRNDSPSDRWVDYPPLWRSPFTAERWIETPLQVSLGQVDASLDGVAGTATRSYRALLAALPGTESSRYTPELSGLDRDEVAAVANLRGVPALPEQLRFASSLSVLAKTGASQGPARLEDQLRGISSFGLLGWVETLLDPLRPLLQVFEPSLAHSCLGVLAVEVVPPDRLGSGLLGPTRARDLPERCL